MLETATLEALLTGEHGDPHTVLGLHQVGDRWVARALHPEVSAIDLVVDGRSFSMEKAHPEGLWEVGLEARPEGPHHFEVNYRDGASGRIGDPYHHEPTIGELDLHLIGEGRHEQLWTVLGSRHLLHQGEPGVAFAVWAPNARGVRVVGDWNGWNGRVNPMRRIGGGGIWELFVPGVEAGARYKYELVDATGRLKLVADPMAKQTEMPPQTASVVAPERSHEWKDTSWMAERRNQSFDRRMSVYEVHLGSWRRVPEEGGRSLTYREIGPMLADHCEQMGFTHVEFMPLAEHPFGGSWGYQVSGYYSPTARYGSPDDLREMVDVLHQRGIGVIVDWVPAHFPRDDFALGRFDGTALYEHSDPRQGEHPDWGTYVFNYGRNEVRNFLIANALYWLDEFHIDGLRVDAVASMLYLDYSREHGEWVPNRHGGRENLEAIDFMRELNTVVHRHYPGALVVAEESTAWDGVTRPVDTGGLGFTQKWNMGWMHDTLQYFSSDPVYRKWEHDNLTFGLVYVWTENFISPLSHDEVVHGKGSLLDKMSGDRWQKFANLRSLYGWMWAHPGKQLLFMGAEVAQWREWDHDSSVDWHLLDYDEHRGIRDLLAELNRVQAENPALYRQDFSPAGFRWLDAADRDNSVYSFARVSGDDTPDIVCVANLTPVPRHGYRIGLPEAGRWLEVLNTDDSRFGGSGVTNGGTVEAEELAWHGCAHSAVMTLPPLGVVWLKPER
ncbi:MAG: 1,4-alpha-glucan branching protein GlgB [Actinomycetota bacterium]|nr:1,4-alpha-glucan branching protein GlgB [Actinomycetota bacterium]